MMLFIEALVALIEKTLYPRPKCDPGDNRCRRATPRRL
jgi:hypothetical protein